METELSKKVKKAIERIKLFEPDDGYYLAYSGGKDSDCIRILADLANVKHEIHHNLTTVDAPETMQYIKSIPNVIIDKARYADGRQKTMWSEILRNGTPPTRLMRYCCVSLKEVGGKGKLRMTGVRWAESTNRKHKADLVSIDRKQRTLKKVEAENAEYKETKSVITLNDDNDTNRRVVEQCYRTDRTIVNPIVDWSDEEVWEFLHSQGCESNPLYKCGQTRIGCIGCPMKSGWGQKADFERYPIYRANYIRAFDNMLKRRKEIGKVTSPEWTDGEAVMAWWVGDLKINKNKGKLNET
jgi:phosphoadenosine phosphosulfate reductase